MGGDEGGLTEANPRYSWPPRDLRIGDESDMDESNLSSENLIAEMTPEEICELLSEMGTETTVDQAAAIQRLIGELGSLEAAFEALQDDSDQADRAAA